MNKPQADMSKFKQLESEVRSYCRSFPTVFARASGHTLFDERGSEYIDFFAGAGVLNYGHNNQTLRDKLIEYLSSDGVTHSLDMATVAKRRFLETLDEVIFQPRDMNYKVMFPGPTGTNAVESALKLARKVTGRSNVISFTNGFHGMTLGSLALTGNGGKRSGAGASLTDATHMPFCGYFGMDADTIEMLETYLKDTSSGIEDPAAFVVETVQAEGGVNVASREWLKRLAKLAKEVGALLIVDDIQVGCGRTGPFFSFEPAGISPDIVCLSKSLSGYGLPLAVTLIKPEYDQWTPGEHNGTFRGHNPAFVTATATLETYWRTDDLTKKVNRDAARVRDTLLEIADEYESRVTDESESDVRGRGLIQGIEFADKSLAGEISAEAFQRGLIIETSGPADETLKVLPPLTIDSQGLKKGLDILKSSAVSVLDCKCAKDARKKSDAVTNGYAYSEM